MLIGKIDELEEAPKIKSNDNENENYLLYINKDTYFFRINNITINFTESTSRKSTKRITDVETPVSFFIPTGQISLNITHNYLFRKVTEKNLFVWSDI